MLISSMQTIRILTDDFQVCSLSSYLSSHLSFPVAIAYGMGLIQPDENGAIRAGETLTRGEAAAVLCNLLSRR